MRTARTATRALVVGLCLTLTTALAACTHAEDWRPHGSSQASSLPVYDTSGIQPQPEIIALLPPGALSDGVLDVGAATDYAPAEFLDASGKPVGYEVDLSRALAAVLGVSATTHTAEFDSIIAVVGSKFDIGLSAFTITTDREAAMNMIAISNVGSQFNVAASNPRGVDPSDHLKLCGLTVGVQTGTAQEEAMSADSRACTAAGRDAIVVRSYSTQSDATTALVGGTIDAVYSDSTVAGYAVAQTGGAVETVGEVEDALPQAIVVSKDDPELTAAVQAAAQYLMDEGVWQDILASWGVEDAALTTAELNPTVEE